MRGLLVTVVVSLGAGPALAGGAGKPALDGKWLIVYAEEGGRRNNAWEQRVATIKGDTLTYETEEKERSMQLSFGPNQTVTAKVGGDGKGKMYQGVCIVSQDYLCISLMAAKAKKAGAEVSAPAEQPVAAVQGEAEQRSSGDFILILRRQRAK